MERTNGVELTRLLEGTSTSQPLEVDTIGRAGAVKIRMRQRQRSADGDAARGNWRKIAIGQYLKEAELEFIIRIGTSVNI